MYKSAAFRSTVTIIIISLAVVHTVRKYSKVRNYRNFLSLFIYRQIVKIKNNPEAGFLVVKDLSAIVQNKYFV